MENIKTVVLGARDWMASDYEADVECPYCHYVNTVYTHDFSFTRMETCMDCGESYELYSDYD